MRQLILVLALILASWSALAADVKSATCIFVEGTSHFFEDGKLTYRMARERERLEMTFDRLDDKNGNGRLVANNGGADVLVRRGQFTINIFEFTPVGNVNVTTMLTRDVVHGGKVQVVHSRHVANLPGLLPSQRVGTCTVFTH